MFAKISTLPFMGNCEWRGGTTSEDEVCAAHMRKRYTCLNCGSDRRIAEEAGQIGLEPCTMCGDEFTAMLTADQLIELGIPITSPSDGAQT